MKRHLVLAGSAAAVVAAATLISPASAQAADSCQGGSYSGHCVSASNVTTASTVVESVPLSNTSPYSATLSCSFSQTISKSLDTSAGVTAGVSAQILGSVSASASVSVSQTVSQSASAASTAGGSITLSPGQSVTCQRVYSYVTTNVREYDYLPSGTTTTASYTATVPSSLGVNIA